MELLRYMILQTWFLHGLFHESLLNGRRFIKSNDFFKTNPNYDWNRNSQDRIKITRQISTVYEGLLSEDSEPPTTYNQFRRRFKEKDTQLGTQFCVNCRILRISTPGSGGSRLYTECDTYSSGMNKFCDLITHTCVSHNTCKNIKTHIKHPPIPIQLPPSTTSTSVCRRPWRNTVKCFNCHSLEICNDKHELEAVSCAQRTQNLAPYCDAKLNECTAINTCFRNRFLDNN